jgi:hypothetical protein
MSKVDKYITKIETGANSCERYTDENGVDVHHHVHDPYVATHSPPTLTPPRAPKFGEVGWGKGKRKTGGSVHGTRTRITISRDVKEIVEKEGLNPAEALVRVAEMAEDKGDLGTARSCYSELLSYISTKKDISKIDTSALIVHWRSPDDAPKQIGGEVIEVIEDNSDDSKKQGG